MNFKDQLLDIWIEKRINEVRELCELEVENDYNELISLLRKIDEQPDLIHDYFSRIEDLYVQFVRVAELAYRLGIKDCMKLKKETSL